MFMYVCTYNKNTDYFYLNKNLNNFVKNLYVLIFLLLTFFRHISEQSQSDFFSVAQIIA